VAFKMGFRLEGVLWIIALTSLIAGAVGMAFVRPVRWDAALFLPVLVRQWIFARWLVGSTVFQWAASNIFYLATGSILELRQ